MHNQNNGSIVFQLCIFDCLGGGEINVYVAVCSEFIAEGGCPRPHHWGGGGWGPGAPLPAPPPGAAENLSTSLFVKEYFACVSFTSSLGIPSHTSGVL